MLPLTLILQFIAMMKKMPDSENELKEAFTAFDADGDGVGDVVGLAVGTLYSPLLVHVLGSVMCLCQGNKVVFTHSGGMGTGGAYGQCVGVVNLCVKISRRRPFSIQ